MPRPANGVIENSLTRVRFGANNDRIVVCDPTRRARRQSIDDSDDDDEQRATTRYWTLCVARERFSLLRLVPQTGRQHQVKEQISRFFLNFKFNNNLLHYAKIFDF